MDHMSDMMFETSPTSPYISRVLGMSRTRRTIGRRRSPVGDAGVDTAHNTPLHSIRRRAPHVARPTFTRGCPLLRPPIGDGSPQSTNPIVNVPEQTLSGDERAVNILEPAVSISESAVSISESLVNDLAQASSDLTSAMNDLAPATNGLEPVANDPESAVEIARQVEVNAISQITLNSEDDNKENIPIPGEPVPSLPSSVVIRDSAVPNNQDVVTHMPFNQCKVVAPASQNNDIQASVEESAVVHHERSVQSALGITEGDSATYRDASPPLLWNVPAIQNTVETPRRITGTRRARVTRRVASRFGAPRRGVPGRQSRLLNLESAGNSAEVEDNFLANLPEVDIFGQNGTPPRTPPHETFDEMSEQRKRQFLGEIRGGEDSFSTTWDEVNEEQEKEYAKISGVMMKMIMNYTTPPPRSLPPPMAPKKIKKKRMNVKKVSLIFEGEIPAKPPKSKRISFKRRKSLRTQHERSANCESDVKLENHGLHTPPDNHRLHTSQKKRGSHTPPDNHRVHTSQKKRGSHISRKRRRSQTPQKKRGSHTPPVAVNTSSMVLRSATKPRRSSRIRKAQDRHQGELPVRNKSNKKRTPPKKKRTAIRA